MKIENSNVLLQVNLTGGSYTDFRFKIKAISTLMEKRRCFSFYKHNPCALVLLKNLQRN